MDQKSLWILKRRRPHFIDCKCITMELLLLDTTENEGEDNNLYHYQQRPPSASSSTTIPSRSAPTSSSWRELRGVLAAAVGTTSSVCGEPLQCAHFRSNGSSRGDGAAGVVGFVNLDEVLYVLVFPLAVNIPNVIVQVRQSANSSDK